jgi:hypothetical protein
MEKIVSLQCRAIPVLEIFNLLSPKRPLASSERPARLWGTILSVKPTAIKSGQTAYLPDVQQKAYGRNPQ